jgi:hypothetical protein
MPKVESSASFPQLPSKVWWRLRDQFKKTVPNTLTDTYLASILEVEPRAASTYLRDLRIIGLVDENNKVLDIAYAWRDDEKYAETCQALMREIYPSELIEIAPPPKPNRSTVSRWFQNSAKLGSGAANNKAAFYLLMQRETLVQNLLYNNLLPPRQNHEIRGRFLRQKKNGRKTPKKHFQVTRK